MKCILDTQRPTPSTFLSILRTAALLVCIGVFPAQADITVMNNADAGVGSLRQAIVDLVAGQTILFDAGLDGQTINLLSPLAISKDMTIDASNIDLTVMLDDIVFDVGVATVTLRGLTIVNLPGAFAAVRCLNGTLTVEKSTLDGADRGIVFVSTNLLTVNNSTVQGANRGIAMGDGAVVANNSTIVGGTLDAIESGGFGVTARNSTLVGVNNATSTINGTTLYSTIAIPSVNGPLNDLGFNLVVATNAAAGIAAALANNGGSTPTFDVLPGSAAIDAGDCALAVFPNHDQRFFGQTNSGPRAVDGDAVPGAVCDVGAVEFLGVPLPVELTAFEAFLDGEAVHLTWTTASETNNAGFEVQRTLPGPPSWETLAFVEGAGTSSEARSYTYRVDHLVPGIHRFRLKQIDLDGTVAYSPVVEVVSAIPGGFVLSEAYPNPLVGRTGQAAQFTLTLGVTQHVEVAVYDLLGRQRMRLHEGALQANRVHRFSLNTEALPGGTYVYRAIGESSTQSRVIIVLP